MIDHMVITTFIMRNGVRNIDGNIMDNLIINNTNILLNPIDFQN